MNKKISIALIALMAFSAGAVSAETNDDMVVCTADAMVCPDGTSVGRTGPNCEFVCGGTTAGVITSNIPAFTAEDKMRGWYYGDKKQMKPGTPADWLVRNAGTRSAQWYNPGLTAEKPIDTANLPPKPPLQSPMPRGGDGSTAQWGVVAPRQTQGSSFGEKARLGATTTSAIKDMRGERKENREEMEKRAKEMRSEVEKKRGEIKDEQMKKRLEMARKQTELVSKRLEQAIERVQKLSDRVAERLTKLEAEGVTTTVSRGHLAEAKTKLEEALTKAAQVKVAIETAFASATLNAGATTTPGTAPKNVMKEAQETVKETVKVIQEAHKHVALAISTVKPGQNKPRPATTTAPATTNETTTQ